VITFDDGVRDVIDCGSNRGKVRDVVTYDFGSRDRLDVLRHCEVVSVVGRG
jgi:hypothetical protein